MMKYLIIMLIILNVSYVTWQNMQSPPYLAQRNDALQHSIELLHEPKEIIQAELENQLSDNAVIQNTSPSCYTIGPFRDLIQLRGLTRAIKPYVEKANFRGREENRRPLYWVYVAPESTYNKALALGERLKADGFNDFYVIRDGNKKNGLSLGHFKSQDGAQKWSEEIADKNFKVFIEAVVKTYTLYWLDYQLAVGHNIPKNIIQKFIKNAEKNHISQLVRNCASE